MKFDIFTMFVGEMFLLLSGMGLLSILFMWTLDKVFKALCSARTFVLFCKWLQDRKHERDEG